MKRSLEFDQYGNSFTTTKSGKDAAVYRNDRNYRNTYYQLVVDGKTVFSRGSLGKVLEKLSEM